MSKTRARWIDNNGCVHWAEQREPNRTLKRKKKLPWSRDKLTENTDTPLMHTALVKLGGKRWNTKTSIATLSYSVELPLEVIKSQPTNSTTICHNNLIKFKIEVFYRVLLEHQHTKRDQGTIYDSRQATVMDSSTEGRHSDSSFSVIPHCSVRS